MWVDEGLVVPQDVDAEVLSFSWLLVGAAACVEGNGKECRKMATRLRLSDQRWLDVLPWRPCSQKNENAEPSDDAVFSQQGERSVTLPPLAHFEQGNLGKNREFCLP